MTLAAIREIWSIDFEFIAPPGEQPQPVCMVAREIRSRRIIRRWLFDTPCPKPPFATGRDVLVIAFYASAEMSCYLALNWKFPRLLIDLYPEFRIHSNGHYVPGGRGLLGALQWFGLNSIGAATKDAMRARIMRGGPFDAAEREAILDYCQSDVDSTEELFPKLIDGRQSLNLSLWRGEFMKTIAKMEWDGVPLDLPLYRKLQEHWPQLQIGVKDKVNAIIPVYENRQFRMALFEQWLESEGLLSEWPVTPAGLLATDDDTFREKSELYPVVEPLRLARQMTGKLETLQLSIGSDGHNRCLLSPFSTKTGRNGPSTTKFIFNTCSFLRNLIQPPPGWAICYIDWVSQEHGIAARLSGDTAMQQAYESGNPYLAFAQKIGAVPAGATKKTHPAEHELFKAVILGTQFQMGPNSLAYRLGVTVPTARHLLADHHRAYGQFWKWSDAVCDYAQICGGLTATLGWRFHFGHGTKIRTLRNFLMQSNGAEMMRLACIYATESGVKVIAPIHDALCIMAPSDEIDHAIWLTQESMKRASEVVLEGFALRSKAEQVVRYPEHFAEARGADMWSWVLDQV